MLDEDGYLPENTERGHRWCAVSAGAPVCGALYQCAAMGRALGRLVQPGAQGGWA